MFQPAERLPSLVIRFASYQYRELYEHTIQVCARTCSEITVSLRPDLLANIPLDA